MSSVNCVYLKKLKGYRGFFSRLQQNQTDRFNSQINWALTVRFVRNRPDRCLDL